MSYFKASWSRSLALTSWIILLVFGGAAVGLLLKEVWFASFIFLSVLFCLALLTIHGYSITADEILIHRLFWKTHLDLSRLESVYFDPRAMEKSIRTAGADGVFATTGYFKNSTLGCYRAFVTDPNNAVVLKFPTETVVLSPATPQSFVQALNNQCSRA